MRTLSGKTLFITGASRGIGRAIALRAARDGANVAIVAKSAVPNPKLPGTIHTVAEEVEAAGGKALPIRCDIREEEEVRSAVAATVDAFGGIDILVNNASAIWLRGTLDTPMKRYDLMQEVNARGTFLCSQACLPHLLKAADPHILSLAPPLNLDPKWWAPHTAYTLAKMGMSFVTLGLAAAGLVGVPEWLVEPLIALSIAFVALENLLEPRLAHRLPVVFGFGLLHGLGFAGALSIDADWSWSLLGSLLSFNIGIEVGQLLLVSLALPLLVLVRRTPARTVVPAAVTTGVAVMGLVWFAQRVPLVTDLLPPALV